MNLFERVILESLEAAEEISDRYLSGSLTKAEAIKMLRREWGEEGYSVDDENAGMYLDYLK